MKEKMKKQIGAIEMAVVKPRVHLDSKMLPQIKDWKVGEKYDIMLRVKQVGLREMEGGGMEGAFEIMKAEVEDEYDE